VCRRALPERCHRLAGRRSVGDFDVIFLVARMLLALAARSPFAAQFIQQHDGEIIGDWRRLLAHAAYSPPAPAPAPGTMGSGGQQSSYETRRTS
jgi:hypothetical protein